MKKTKDFFSRRMVALFMAVLMVISVIVPSQPAAAEETTTPGTEGTVIPGAGTEVATSDVTIKVVDSVNNAIDLTSGVTLVVKNGENAIIPTESVYVLKQGVEYTYSLSGKTGYADTTGAFTVEAKETSTVEVEMVMNDIEVSVTSETLKVGDTATASVTNAIAGASYTWATTDAGVASVDATTGAITAVAEGTAKITASYNGKTSREVAVTVSKRDTAIQLDVDPTKGGTDQNKVVVDVTDIPSDATGVVQFFVNSTKKNEVTLSGQTELEWTYEDSDLRGDYTFYAVYSGDGKYNGSTSATVDAKGFTKSQKIVFSDTTNAELVPYITTVKEGTFDVPISVTKSNIKTELEFKSSDENILKVDADGIVTIVGSGEAYITITAIEKDNYLEATATYYVYVEEEYKLSGLEDKLQVATASKIYDGNEDVKVTATLSNLEQLKLFTGDCDASKGLVFDITAKVSSKNATSYNEITVVSIDKITGKDAKGNDVDLTGRILPRITDIDKEKLVADYTINQRTVYLGTNAWTMTYGSKATEKIATKTGLVKEIKVAAESETGVVDGDTVAFVDFKATVAKDIYDIGEHAETVQVNYNASKAIINANSNYEFVDSPDKANFGTLTVLQANLTLAEILANISITADGGKLYQNPDKAEEIWINGGLLRATVGTDYQPYYDAVMFKLNSDITDLTSIGYDVSDITTSKITGKLYLQKAMNTCAEVDFSFTVDTTAPDFTFGDWTERTTVLDTWVGMITFNKYVNNYYTIENIDYDDDVIENALQESVTQSGVDSWKYHVYKVTDDEQLTEAKLQEYVKTVKWTDETTDKTIPVCTETNGSLDEVQGNYIVLVKITDMVGNSVVYSTNGLVIDVTAPTVEILAADDSKLDQTKYYQDSVAYKVELIDSETSAGLESAVIQVFDGDKEIDKYEYSFADDTKSYTLSELNGLSTKTITQDKAGKDLVITTESNNLKIVVTAIDQAGNECDPVEQKLMIDATAPKIDVEFNNDADVKNDKYFNTDRVMTIKYTEKNFNQENVTFDVGTGTNLSFTELCVEYDITKYSWTDSQETSDMSSYGNNRENTLTLTFDKDREYTIVPHCKDLSEKTESSITYVGYEQGIEPGYVKEFVVDKTNPVVQVEYIAMENNGNGGLQANPIELSTNENNRTYRQETIKATVSIDEKNFSLADKFSSYPETTGQMNFEATKGERPKEGVDNYQEFADEVANWSKVDNTYSQTFVFEKDAEYTFAMAYTDLAGNPAVYNYGQEKNSFETVYFTVDDTDPNGGIGIQEVPVKENEEISFIDIFKEIWHTITFNIFRNYEHVIQIKASDITAGVDTVEYYKTTKPIDSSNVDARDEELAKVEWKAPAYDSYDTETDEYRYRINVDPEEQDEEYVVYARITDKAKNVRYIYPEKAVISEKTAPTISTQIVNETDARNNIYNEDVKIRVTVVDPEVGDTYSGIEKVWYTVYASGNKTVGDFEKREGGKVYDPFIDNSNAREANGDLEIVKKSGLQTFTEVITIPAVEEYNTNDVKVVIHAVDFAGNQYDTYTEPVELSFDITEPTIKVEYDLNEPLNGSYYNATRTATVTVTERNFDPSAIRWNITNTDNVQPVISDWTSSVDAGVKDAATHTCKVTFAADGDYTLTMNCTDLAGNDSKYTQVDSFTIDQTKPVIGVAFDNNNVKNATYFDAPRTATITVTEHNFNSNEVITAIIATLESRGITVPPVSSWTTVGDVHTATVYFGADGDYAFTVNYSDLAGNAATEVKVSEFTIDQTKPVVEIFDIVDKSANNGVVAPGVRYSDVNYNENNVSITIKGAQHNEKTVDGTRSPITNGQSIKMADFAYEEDVDDVYTLTVKATDQAGNFDEKSVIFSVNRFGSNFIFSVTTESFLEKYYSNEEQDLVVTEINVDTLEHRGISYGRDGEHVDLEEGTDYSVKASGNEVTWKSYEYTINAANFEEEGLYNVTIDSLDRATNQVNNKIKDADIEFVIDKTKPTVVITGIEAGGQYRAAERDISIAVTDNVAMTDVDVRIDDKSIGNFDAVAIMEQDGKLPVTLGSDTNWQYVTAVATDAAGNVAETSEYGVLITTNVLIQYYRNTPVFVGSLVGVAAVAGFIFFLAGKKKKKEGQ